MELMIIKNIESRLADEVETCHECGLNITIPSLKINQKATCPRCGYLLSAKRANALERILAFAITALIFLLASVSFNFISFEFDGLGNNIKMFDSVMILIDSGYSALAIIEVITVFIIPTFVLSSLIYIVCCLRYGRYPWKGHALMGGIFKLLPWNMVEIFLVGTLVSLIKITSVAEIILGPSFFAFILFSVSMTAVLLHLDKRYFYQALDSLHTQYRENIPTSSPLPPNQVNGEAMLNRHMSIQKTWALIITSILLYIPANMLPIMNTWFLGQDDPSTIIGGVIVLWHHGSYPIAIVIFIASIMVPIAKILVLIWLNYSVQIHLRRLEHQRIRMYRIAEFIGRWSMVDIFVVIILVSLVQLGNTINIVPGVATFALSGVVIITMLAAMSFEPKLIYSDKITYEKT
jgi:paraquat-inducible protein A